MKNRLIKSINCFLICLLALLSYSRLEAQPVADEKLLIRISYQTAEEKARIEALGLEIVREKPGEFLEARLTWDRIIQMHADGFDLVYILELNISQIDSQYHTLEEVGQTLESLHEQAPQILALYKIGESTTRQLPVWAAKISDNPAEDEDEPAILLTGAHHAREPLSTEVCLHLINKLCTEYASNPVVAEWVNSTEIWVVPVVNPDGYSVVFDSNRNLNWWRKNLRDNNGNDIFDADNDGVDLNRNYDFHWQNGGSKKTGSLYFRGSEPFSETETRVLKKLIEKERFAFILDFHSFGEAILYPWSNFTPPPDSALIVDLAEKLASKIKKNRSSETYDIIPLDAQMGQSSIWHYGVHGIMSFTIEVGPAYFPPGAQIKQIAENNIQAVFYLLDRLKGARFTGHVLDAISHQPVEAKLDVVEFQSALNNGVQSEKQFGRFSRILLPGTYSVQVSAPGYHPKILQKIVIVEKNPTVQTIYLNPQNTEKSVGNE